MSLRDTINKIRNGVVVGMSKVHATDGPDTREIKNGKDRYVVQKTVKHSENVKIGDPRDLQAAANFDQVSFRATDNSGNSQIVTLEKLEIVESLSVGQPSCQIMFGTDAKKSLDLPDDTDISNIKEVRYQLDKASKGGSDKAKQLAYFIDKFVIVTPEERKAYKEYATKMDKEAKQRAIITDKSVSR